MHVYIGLILKYNNDNVCSYYSTPTLYTYVAILILYNQLATSQSIFLVINPAFHELDILDGLSVVCERNMDVAI